MSTGIEKFRMEERIRRLFFKHRGDINAIIEETKLDGNYIRKVTKKVRRGFQHDVNFEIACFITDAILSGREQRLIILEDRLNEILKKKETVSICHAAPVSEHKYEGSTWYKCKMCLQNCETQEVDRVDDNHVAKLIDRMRKEDEFIGKFLAAMGIIANNPEGVNPISNPEPSRIPAQDVEVKSLPPAEKKLMEKLRNLPESKIIEIRHFVESKINEALDEPNNS